jgi:hypothetical protein
METLKISGTEAAAMKSFYQEELTKTLNKLRHIQAVLEQLGDASANIHVTVGGAVAAGNSAPVQTVSETPKKKESGKKRGPKSIWGTFILKRLQQLDKPLTYNELVDEAMVYFKLNESKRQTVVNAINNSAFRLRKNSGRVDTFGAGSREKYVALKSWFEAPGKIKPEYLKKISKPKKRTGKKPGPKPGSKRNVVAKAPVTRPAKAATPTVKVKSAQAKKK